MVDITRDLEAMATRGRRFSPEQRRRAMSRAMAREQYDRDHSEARAKGEATPALDCYITVSTYR